eukprot:737873-Pelagomonas_calceolata.AAC.1
MPHHSSLTCHQVLLEMPLLPSSLAYDASPAIKSCLTTHASPAIKSCLTTNASPAIKSCLRYLTCHQVSLIVSGRSHIQMWGF